MSIKAAGDGGHCQPQPRHGFAGVVQAVGEAHASDPTEPESPPGSCSKPFNFRHVCSCPIAFLLLRCHGLRGGAEPARGAPCTAQKVTQLGRYKSPEADILISFLMSCINAIQAELSWCPVNIHQSRCKASGQSARTKAVSGVSGRACHLSVFGKKPGEERTREQTRLSVCLWVVSELGVQDQPQLRQVTYRPEITSTYSGDGVMLNFWTFLDFSDFKYKGPHMISGKEVCRLGNNTHLQACTIQDPRSQFPGCRPIPGVWRLLLGRQCQPCSSDTVRLLPGPEASRQKWETNLGAHDEGFFPPGLILSHHISYPFASTYWRTLSNSRASSLHFRVSFLQL